MLDLGLLLPLDNPMVGTWQLTHILEGLSKAIDVLYMVAHTTEVVGRRRSSALRGRAILDGAKHQLVKSWSRPAH